MVADCMLLRPYLETGTYCITPCGKLLRFFVEKRGNKCTTWATICSQVCVISDLKGSVESLTNSGYLKKLKNGWRITPAGVREARTIWPNL